MNFDIIVIGSGAGGLSAAICLSRAGKKVLVLEQHDVPGGWCHSFYIKGHRFSPGVHYIGNIEEGQSTSKLYKGLGIANDLVFFQMNPEAYEHCWIGDERFDLPAGFDVLYERLIKRFPKEKKGLARYLQTVEDVGKQLDLIPQMDGFWDNLTIAWRTRHLGKYGLFSLKRVIDWHIKDPLLKKVLNVQCGDHGLPPGKSSFPVHCGVMNHYANGGFYPMGGGAAIVKAMTSSIKSYGGEIRTSQKVKRILLEGKTKKKAIGVELESGEQLFAEKIISNTDPGISYLKLIGEENLSSKLIKKLKNTKYSCTSLILFLVVDIDLRKEGMDSGNVWLMPDRDLDEFYNDMLSVDIGSGEEFQGLFISFPTLKDPTSFDGRHHSIEVITFINHEAFKQYRDENYSDTKEYLAFKKVLMAKMIKGLENVIPGIGERIVEKELGTPMTNKHYIKSTDGNVYGTEKSLGFIGPFGHKAKSEIENYYLCGSSIMAHGVAGSSYSGVETAALILDCKKDDLIKNDSSQKLRVFSSEDSSEYPDWLIKKIEMKKERISVK